MPMSTLPREFRENYGASHYIVNHTLLRIALPYFWIRVSIDLRAELNHCNLVVNLHQSVSLSDFSYDLLAMKIKYNAILQNKKRKNIEIALTSPLSF